MRTILIVVDALTSNYLTNENMPFLYSLTNKSAYIKKITPSFGFCERTEILAGVPPSINGNVFAIGYDPKQSEYRNERLVLSMLSKIPSLDKYIRYIHYRFFRKYKALGMYKIPLHSLHNFVLTEDGPIRYGNYETIFEVLDKENKTYDMSFFTSLSNKQVQKKEKDVVDFEHDFIPIYIGEIDSFGHKYADSIDKLIPYLLEVDHKLKDIYEKYQSLGEFRFAIIGDHGMEPVKQEVDVLSALESIDAKQGLDYEVFIDSTSCRVWFYTPDVERKILSVFEKLNQFGRIVENDEAINRHVDVKIVNSDGTRVYGDLLWCANVGTLIHQDYFNGSKVHYKGMHGYFDIGYHSYGLAVFWGDGISNKVVEKGNLFDVCPTLCDMLSIRKPDGCIGKSFIDNG